ncbi:GPW/gp25 family protein [Basfia succiniciproducens]|uniref:GPW/gp25 family protein n=1 Tax=Basfia succiniciproducens TaxID=653940 RepID=UPI003FCCE5B0
MNRDTGKTLTDESDHIKQSVADILTTQIGTRIARRDYGSNIPKLIDRPIDRILMLQLASSAVMALTKWEPRIKISQFKPSLNDGKITATLVGTRNSTGSSIKYDNLLLGGK